MQKPLGKALRGEELRQGKGQSAWGRKEKGGHRRRRRHKRWEPQWGGKKRTKRGRGGREGDGEERGREAQIGRGRRGKKREECRCGFIFRKPDSTGHISQGNQHSQGPSCWGGWGWGGAAKQAARPALPGTPRALLGHWPESTLPSPPWAQCRLELIPGWRAGESGSTCPLPLRVWTSSG